MKMWILLVLLIIPIAIADSREEYVCSMFKRYAIEIGIDIVYGNSKDNVIRELNDHRVASTIYVEGAREMIDLAYDSEIEYVEDARAFGEMIYLMCLNNNTFETGSLLNKVEVDNSYRKGDVDE